MLILMEVDETGIKQAWDAETLKPIQLVILPQTIVHQTINVKKEVTVNLDVNLEVVVESPNEESFDVCTPEFTPTPSDEVPPPVPTSELMQMLRRLG